MSHPIEGMLGVSMEKIRDMIDVNTIIGTPIVTPDGKTTIIPVSKVSFGFGSGGSDIPNKVEKELFGGGAGAGVSLHPLAFLVVSEEGVELLQMDEKGGGADKVIAAVPDAVKKVMDMFDKKKCDKKKNKKTDEKEED